MPNPSTEVRNVDKLLERFNQEEFINFVQSPAYLSQLKTAVSFLIENWPTDEQIQILHDSLRNPDRAPSQLDKKVVSDLKTGRTLITGYNAQEAASDDNAKVFWLLGTVRPWRDSAFDRFRAIVDDALGKALFLISKN